MTHIIAKSQNVSGELFDLSVPTLNNAFGYEHITYNILHGISIPIDKYIEELNMILKDGGPPDDKTEKRQARLRFLNICKRCKELEELFPLFCNYINGGGTGSMRAWHNEEYKHNFLIISVAGGNIITVFAQIIVNIFDSFIKSVNSYVEAIDYEYESWDIYDDFYSPEVFDKRALPIRDYMFDQPFRNWNRFAQDTKMLWDIINETYRLLTPTTQILLEELENNSNFSKEQIAFLICSNILGPDRSRSGSSESEIRNIADNQYSDFDFKLAPNIMPEILNDTLDGSAFIREIDSKLKAEYGNINKPPGFLLLRAKSLIVCKADTTIKKYSSKQLIHFRKECAKTLGSWAYSLFPQTMQKEFLKDVDPYSNCAKFLNYLLEKKNIISQATRYNIDEILKLFLTGYYKPVNSKGDEYAIVPPSKNSTEATINYIKHTTYNLNIYIQNWESKKLSHYAAPGLHYDRDNIKFNYRGIVFSFLSLGTLAGKDGVLYQNSNLITKLASDIINYFLNNPIFQTETILDSLIKSVNNKRKEMGLSSNCIMPPSDITMAPSSKYFTPALRKIKNIFETSKYSELGYPDGLRITINAIESEQRTVDTRTEEENIRTEMKAVLDNNNIEYLPLPSRSDSVASSSGSGVKIRNKKRGSRKRGSRKRGSRKHGSKKHN